MPGSPKPPCKAARGFWGTEGSRTFSGLLICDRFSEIATGLEDVVLRSEHGLREGDDAAPRGHERGTLRRGAARRGAPREERGAKGGLGGGIGIDGM